MGDNTHNIAPSGSEPPANEGKASLPALPENAIVNMEVHHHPDLHHKKKKLKEYFLEFLMIFLAVTLGFFAESLREHIGDGEKEHEYMQSFLNNLRDDSTNLVNTLLENGDKEKRLDSLCNLSAIGLLTDSLTKMVYTYTAGSVSYYSLFKTNDATMLQLKNSGGLRFIKKAHAADSIAKYDGQVKIIYAAESMYIAATDQAAAAAQEVLDYSIYYDSSFFRNHSFTSKPLRLLTTDPQKVKYFFNKVIYEKGATKNYNRNLQFVLPSLQSLIRYLKATYQLE